MTLTPKQVFTLDFISSFIEANGFAPSIDEIRKAKGLRSLAAAHKAVTELEAKGLIRRKWNVRRSIELLQTAGHCQTCQCPLAAKKEAKVVETSEQIR